MSLPILYTFRRCPYAIRTRLSLALSEIKYEAREVVLKDKPKEMLCISPKGTVPVLQLEGGIVIDESRDIMLWAFESAEVSHYLPSQEMTTLVDQNDHEFKYWLDRYKYADRYPDNSELFYRQQAEEFIHILDELLSHQTFLFGEQPSYADIAIFPFVRQFAHVDKQWFFKTHYHHVIRWLEHWLEHQLFLAEMKKYPQWQSTN